MSPAKEAAIRAAAERFVRASEAVESLRDAPVYVPSLPQRIAREQVLCVALAEKHEASQHLSDVMKPNFQPTPQEGN